MDQKGWSQRDLARRAGLSQSQVGNILRGAHSPALDTAESLAQAFDLHAWQLQVSEPGSLTLRDCERLSRIIKGFLAGTDKDRAIIETVTDSTGKFRSLDG
jgi:transcriptional regulator with XRE-family HTH domain